MICSSHPSLILTLLPCINFPSLAAFAALDFHQIMWGSFMEPQEGVVVFRRSTSRVYNMNSNCREETQHTVDAHRGVEELRLSRALGVKSATLTQTKDLRSGEEASRVNLRNLNADEENAFEQRWMQEASRYLPPYCDNHRSHASIPCQREPISSSHRMPTHASASREPPANRPRRLMLETSERR
jgi:hypothetical protein